MNMKAIDGTLERLVEIKYPAEKWMNMQDLPNEEVSEEKFYLTVQKPILTWKGNDLPVSVFEPGGMLSTVNTTRIEKRKIAHKVLINN